MTTRTTAVRSVSAPVRPASTTHGAIGMLRSRSTMPVRRSVASPTAVVMPAKATVCTKMPGIR
jgi:hypothetical protein